jgi:hypothetical protein
MAVDWLDFVSAPDLGRVLQRKLLAQSAPNGVKTEEAGIVFAGRCSSMQPCGTGVQKLAEVSTARSGRLILNGLRPPGKLAPTPCFIQRLSGSKHGAKKVRARSVTPL